MQLPLRQDPDEILNAEHLSEDWIVSSRSCRGPDGVPPRVEGVGAAIRSALTAYRLVLPDHPLGRRQKAEAVRRRRRRPSMCGRPEPATAKVLPTRPSKDGSGRGGSAPGTSATFTKYARTGPIPSRS